ncbi:MAG: NAD(P)-dependent alcohol dehydrogenase [Clostridiaceae bacterium]|nr:NAD(P)-dependent alcohol dehydrogenase [Clostridiaceae bacterium]
MKAVYLEETKHIKIRDIAKPVPGPGEVLVKVDACGVCGSDVHYWQHGRIGDFIVKEPMILGHEAAGTVVELGSGVDNVKVGDIVALEPGIPCMKCDNCRNGLYNLCPDVQFFATPPVDGVMKEYVVHPAELVYPAPAGLSAKIASLAEPFSVGVHALRLANFKAGQKALVLGAGIIGICVMIAAFESGASEVAVVDIQDARLERAKALGATEVINSKNGELKHQYYDAVFECTGAQACAISAIKAARSGGEVVMIGMGPDDMMQVPLLDAICREVTIHGSFRYRNSYPVALSIIAKRKDLFEKLITHDFTIDEAEKAFETALSDPTACKVMVNI